MYNSKEEERSRGCRRLERTSGSLATPAKGKGMAWHSTEGHVSVYVYHAVYIYWYAFYRVL